jgi:uncharacterized protein YdeI (YjbR/CyaY-like superfamily)
MPPAPRFFRDAAEFRRWLEKHHASEKELFVGLYKKSSGKGGLTYPEAVLEALCFGWIDGVMKSLGAESYMQRFTPRKPGSIWSRVNVAHVERLTQEGRMAPAGLAAFAARTKEKTGIYSFERKEAAKLTPAFTKKFRAARAAWDFFQAQPAWYRRQITHWIISAKHAETRERRLARTIAASGRGERLK